MIKKIICLKNYQDRSNAATYNYITGLTINGDLDYYTGQTDSDSYVGYITISLTQAIDDLGYCTPIIDEWEQNKNYNSGTTIYYNESSYLCLLDHTSGLEFDENYWMITPTGNTTGYTVTLTGETKIDQFRRYGKTDLDPDLYNDVNNTGFTNSIYTSDGIFKQLVGKKENPDGLSYQPLYDYRTWVSGKTGTTINYSDIGDGNTIITYETSGLTHENSLESQCVKIDYLIGIIDKPKIDIDVFIDRGSNLSFDRHLKLGDLNSLNDIELYGNGYYIIKED